LIQLGFQDHNTRQGYKEGNHWKEENQVSALMIIIYLYYKEQRQLKFFLT
jgi:hypothetical protein